MAVMVTALGARVSSFSYRSFSGVGHGDCLTAASAKHFISCSLHIRNQSMDLMGPKNGPGDIPESRHPLWEVPNNFVEAEVILIAVPIDR